MKKMVSVYELINIARTEKEEADRYYSEGKPELGEFALSRVSGMITLITVSAVSSDPKVWDKEWSRIYDYIMEGVK